MKGKLAWLCYGPYTWDDPDVEDCEVEFKTTEPESYAYKKVVPIVYFELED